jgi:hypothetical protein
MTSIQKNNRAGALIAAAEPRLDLVVLAMLTAIPVDELRRCRDCDIQLRPAAQLRLARAITLHVPSLARDAKRLEAQALAADTFQSGATEPHKTYPRVWETTW